MGEFELERLIVRLVGDGSSYMRMLHQASVAAKQATSGVLSHTQAVERMQQSIENHANTVKGVLIGVAGAVGIGGGLATLQSAIERFGQQEQLEIAFETLVGDVGKAKKALADLTKFAADTPFELPELMEAAKSALAFGQEIETIVPTMRMLGDISAGLNIPIGQLTYLFGTLKSQGRAFTTDINQFAMRGIPIWQELEKITGKNNQEVRKLVETGQVGFPIVEQAFKNMVGAGGRFGGLMEKQSKSLLGLWSTLKDSIGQILTDIGKEFSESVGLKGIIEDTGKLAAEFSGWLKSLPPETKRAALAVAVVTVAVGALTAAAIALGVAITYASGGLNLFAVALAAISGVTIAGISGLVISVGGIANAWNLVKEKALAAWEWLLPVRRAVTSFFNALKDSAVQKWGEIETFVVRTWERVSAFLRRNGMMIDFGKLRLQLVEFFILAEYSLDHFNESWQLAQVAARYYFEYLKAEITHIVGTTLPELSRWWSKVFPQFVGVALRKGIDLWTDYVAFVGKLLIGTALFAAKVQVDAFRIALTEGPSALAAFGDRMKTELRGFIHGFRQGDFGDIVIPPLSLSPRAEGELEAYWRKEFEKAKGAFDAAGFAEFRKKKLEEFFTMDPATQQKVVDEATKTGDKVSEQLGKMTKEAEKFDQAVYGSAEALQRLQAWRDRQARTEKGIAPGSAVLPILNGGGSGVGAIAGGMGAALPVLNKMNENLAAIKTNTKTGGLIPANLET